MDRRRKRDPVVGRAKSLTDLQKSTSEAVPRDADLCSTRSRFIMALQRIGRRTPGSCFGRRSTDTHLQHQNQTKPLVEMNERPKVGSRNTAVYVWVWVVSEGSEPCQITTVARRYVQNLPAAGDIDRPRAVTTPKVRSSLQSEISTIPMVCRNSGGIIVEG